MIAVAPLAAALGDILGPIIFILVLVISVVGQIVAKLRESQQQAQKRAQGPRPPRPPQTPPGRVPAVPKEDPLKDEIGEFLRRAAERRGTASSPRRSPPVAPAARPTSPPPSARPSPRPVAAELVEARPVRPAAVAPRVGTQPIVSADLGHDVEQADERMASHLQTVFAHQVGTLSSAQSEAMARAAATPTASAGLMAMLRDPLSMRQAIVLNEILQRPEHRWE